MHPQQAGRQRPRRRRRRRLDHRLGSAMATLARVRAEHESRLGEQKQRQERSKNLVVLMLHHLTNAGYSGAAEALQSDSGITMAQYDVADNIDLLSVLQEFEDYYELRFARRPKLTRKLSKFSPDLDPHGRGPGSLPRIPAARSGRARGTATGGQVDGGEDPAPAANHSGRRVRPGGGKENRTETGKEAAGGDGVSDPSSLAVSGQAAGHAKARVDEEDPWEHRVRKAGLPASMAANAELRELATWLQRDMIQRNPNVRWDDIAELGDVKRVLKESLVMPLRYPQVISPPHPARRTPVPPHTLVAQYTVRRPRHRPPRPHPPLRRPPRRRLPRHSTSRDYCSRGRACSSTAHRARARPCSQRRSPPSATRRFSTSPPRPSSPSGAATRRSSCASSSSSAAMCARGCTGGTGAGCQLASRVPGTV